MSSTKEGRAAMASSVQGVTEPFELAGDGGLISLALLEGALLLHKSTYYRH